MKIVHFGRAAEFATALVCVVTLVACGGSGVDERVFSDDPTASPTPLPSPSGSPMPSMTPAASPMPSPSPTATPSATPSVTPTPTPTMTPTPSPEPATLAELQSAIFTPICSECHRAGGIAAGTGLFLDSEVNSRNNLVGVASSAAAGEVRVIPGNADNSYLIKKLEGRPGIVGSRMPRGGTPLDAAQMAEIASWINSLEASAGELPAQVMKVSREQRSDSERLVVALSSPYDSGTLSSSGIQVYAVENGSEMLLVPRAMRLSEDRRILIVELDSLGPMRNWRVIINDPAFGGIRDGSGRVVDADGDHREGGALRLELAPGGEFTRPPSSI